MPGREETLGQVYAKALLGLASDKGVPAEVLAELKELDRLLERDRLFHDFLCAPNVRLQAKKDVIEKVLGDHLSEITLNFLKLVLDKRRQVHLREMVRAYEAEYHEQMGELVVRVESAVALEAPQRQRLIGDLKKKHKKDIILEERVKPALLGGLVLKIGDSRVDGSLRTRLEMVGSRLAAVRLRSEEYYEDQG
jgi:F-type H+-transporting ATPase subunit delta